MRRRRAAWGAAAVVLYLAVVAAFSGSGPTRPLYDSFAPPGAYRWVSPPPEAEAANQPPLSARQELGLKDTGSFALSVTTQDAQAAIVFMDGTFAPRTGEDHVVVDLEPLDPATVGAPPKGLRFDGNAYRATVVYPISGESAAPTLPVTVVLRFPSSASKLLSYDGSRWITIPSEVIRQALQIYGKSPGLGTFVAAGVDHRATSPPGFSWLYVSLGAAAAAVGAAGFFWFRRSKRPAGSGPPG